MIAGAHWQSDVDVSRVAASIAYSRLQTSPAFRAQMAQAQEEFRRLTFASGRPAVPAGVAAAPVGREAVVSVTDVVPVNMSEHQLLTIAAAAES